MAIKLYTDAINLDPFIASYYGNRSFAYIKTECFGYGLADANKALELDKTYVKVTISNGLFSRENVIININIMIFDMIHHAITNFKPLVFITLYAEKL